METLESRIANLEHDNNIMRIQIANLTMDYNRMIDEFHEVSQKSARLVKTVNEFVSRFSVVQ